MSTLLGHSNIVSLAFGCPSYIISSDIGHRHSYIVKAAFNECHSTINISSKKKLKCLSCIITKNVCLSVYGSRPVIPNIITWWNFEDVMKTMKSKKVDFARKTIFAFFFPFIFASEVKNHRRLHIALPWATEMQVWVIFHCHLLNQSVQFWYRFFRQKIPPQQLNWTLKNYNLSNRHQSENG